MKRIRVALTLGALLACVGCIDYEEEVWLKEDGSGTAQITVKLPEQLMAMAGGAKPPFSKEEAGKGFADSPGIRVVKVEEIHDAGTVGFRVHLSFDSLGHLEQSLRRRQTNGASVAGSGQLSLARHGSSVHFHRLVTPNKPAGKSSRDPSAESMVAIFFANHFMTYRYHFPYKISSANTTQIDPKTNTAEWKFPLAQAVSGDLEMQADLKPQASLTWIWAATGVGGALVLAIAILALSRRRTVSAVAVPQTAPRFRTREEYEAWKASQNTPSGS